MHDRFSNEGPGKRVGGCLYIHRSALSEVGESEHELLCQAERIAALAGANVLKICPKARRVSFLTYERFFEDPFPALSEARSVDLSSCRAQTIRYRLEGNPPILHRKELLLPAADPRRKVFGALTQDLEAQGLLEDAHRVGFKRSWEARLAERGFRVEGHQLMPSQRSEERP